MGLYPSGTCCTHDELATENHELLHVLQTVSAVAVHCVETSEPAMQPLQGTQEKEPSAATTRLPSVFRLQVLFLAHAGWAVHPEPTRKYPKLHAQSLHRFSFEPLLIHTELGTAGQFAATPLDIVEQPERYWPSSMPAALQQ